MRAVLDYLYPHFVGSMHAMVLSLWVLVPLFILELLFPARKLHLPTMGFNLLYAPLFMTMTGVVLGPVSGMLDPHLPRDLLGGAPGQWPWWQTSLMVVTYLLSFDFCYYWFHRAQHTWPFLWRFHRFHHSDISISSTSSFRHHWMEETFRYFVIAIPLYMMFGRPTDYAPLIGLTIGAFGLFIHSNLRLELGPLTHVIVGPRYHRMHHSIAESEINKNFATLFPLWDRVFGTQAMPRKNEHPETGIATDRKPNGILQILPVPPLHS